MGKKKNITNQEALALLEQYKTTKNQKFLGQLYEPYMRMVLGIGLKYFKELPKAEDLVVDVYEVLVKKIAQQDIQNVSSWIYSVAKNECLMALRKKKREFSSEDLNYNASAVESEEVLHLFEKKEEEFKRLDLCIEQLKKEQKTCVKAFYLNNKTYKEIAQQQNMDVKKVKSHIQNGKRNLKICMENK